MFLNERSKQIRRNLYRLSKANGGYHYGGSFSCVEILIALFDYILRPVDKFVLSKGHAAFALYTFLLEKGLHPLLEGHPHLDPANGVHFTSGSMGHGFPAAVGMAMARKLQDIEGKIYVLMGDGECQEGTTWEALLLAAKFKLNNLVVIIDHNELQACGKISDILPCMLPLDCAATTSGWVVIRTDGHEIEALKLQLKYEVDGPLMIIAHTTKGAGVSFMENQPAWHSNWPNAEQEAIILQELA